MLFANPYEDYLGKNGGKDGVCIQTALKTIFDTIFDFLKSVSYICT